MLHLLQQVEHSLNFIFFGTIIVYAKTYKTINGGTLMSLIINHNMMAMNASRNLGQSYSNLSTSVRRLSSGLRVGTAADDAAGLAIRELMRADIVSLNQGVRNANDAISMIQTADGALGVVDEKLIRMKELAEQAATGTYNSDQRLMIESEYQAMASEITRIANTTDFNGVYLLNGNLSASSHNGAGLASTAKMKIHFGTGNDSAEDYYYIQIGNATASALGVGNQSDPGGRRLHRIYPGSCPEVSGSDQPGHYIQG
jgi:flagellin